MMGVFRMPRIILLHGRDVIADLYFPQSKQKITLGRQSEADIGIPDPEISRIHAVIEQSAGEYVITDANAKNGLVYKRERVARHVLKPGDEIDIGVYTLVYKGEELDMMEMTDSKGQVVDVIPASHVVTNNVLVPSRSKRSMSRRSGETVTVNMDQLGALQQNLRQKRAAFLDQLENGVVKGRVPLQRNRLVFGKGEDANIQVGGLFAPKTSAVIEFMDGGFVILGHNKQLVVNGQQTERKKLAEGDRISVSGREFVFHDRVAP
ncbi:MAG: hypothetical protein GMKNLPBB_02210 [Myxococcota bacterium]|nr:hypothetical protein [Myxococcota bacterium]